MENLDWGAIGTMVAIFFGVITTIGVIATVIQCFKKEKDTSNNSVNQNIKGGIFFKSHISQNVDKKE